MRRVAWSLLLGMGIAVVGATSAAAGSPYGRLLTSPGLYVGSRLEWQVGRNYPLPVVVVSGLVWGLAILAAWTALRRLRAERGAAAIPGAPSVVSGSSLADTRHPGLEKPSSRTSGRVGLALLVAAVLVPGAVWFRTARAAASCVDRGGSFNDSTGQCDFVTLHVRVAFVSGHRGLVILSAAALLLGAVLLARGGSRLPILPFRSPAERRALLSCLVLGIVAVALASVALATGRLPPFLHGFNRRGRDFWAAALVLGVDFVLVLGGSRGPRTVAVAAAGLLGLAFLLFAGFGLLFVWFAAGMAGESEALRLFIPILLMGAVQWTCLRAVNERL